MNSCTKTNKTHSHSHNHSHSHSNASSNGSSDQQWPAVTSSAVASTYLQMGHLKPSCLASVATILNILVKSPVCMTKTVECTVRRQVCMCSMLVYGIHCCQHLERQRRQTEWEQGSSLGQCSGLELNRPGELAG